MTIKYGSTLTVETVGEAVMDNYKNNAAYYWTAYNPAAKDEDGLHPAYRLIYTVPGGMTDPDDIDWSDPDDIQPAGAYDPETGRII